MDVFVDCVSRGMRSIQLDLAYLSLLRQPRDGRTLVVLVGVQSHQFSAVVARRSISFAIPRVDMPFPEQRGG